MAIAGILIPLLMILLSCLIIWKSAHAFELAADYLGRNMHEGIKGATINAIASSMPEFLSTIFFLFYIRDVNGFSGGIGITAGSAIYNLLVIPAGVIIFTLVKNPGIKIRINKLVSLRDGIFLVFTTVLLIIVLNFGKLNWLMGASLVIAYLIYLGFLFYREKINKHTPSTSVVANYKRRKSATNDYYKMNIEALVLGNNEINAKNAKILLVVSTFVMAIGTWILVQATDWLGAEEYTFPFIGELKGLNIPILFVALILAAAASSLPDTIISIKDAKKGNYEDAFSNALGSNIFDISFALGMPLLIYTIIFGTIEMDPQIIEFSLGIWEVLLFLTIITIIIFTVGKHMNARKAILMLFLYLCFLILIIGLVLDNDFFIKVLNYVTGII